MKKNQLTKLAYLSIFLITLYSCLEKKEPLKQECGVVIEKQYVPSVNQTVTGTGFSTGGNVVTTTHYINDDEKYIVIFKCEHGVVFSINKDELYGKLNKGDSVVIDYYELVNSVGDVKDLDFVDANLKK